MVKSNIRKRNLKTLFKKMEKAGERLSGVKVDKDPKVAKLELDMLGIATRVKKEGING